MAGPKPGGKKPPGIRKPNKPSKGGKGKKGKDDKEEPVEVKEPEPPVIVKLSSRQHPYYLFGLRKKGGPDEEEEDEEYSGPRLPAHMIEWLEKNAGPKRRNLSKLIVKKQPCRWAKPGPHTRRDWIRFYMWAAKNAIARPEYEPPVEEVVEKKGFPDEEEDPKSPEEREAHIAKLATPRHPREKHKFPDEAPTSFTYSPKIDFKKAAHKDKGRPVIMPEVPRKFLNNEAKEEFWMEYRFPISKKAINCRVTERYVLMAIPRVTPPDPPHCPIPEKPIEYVAPRRKMTYRQWRQHLRRLEYLARPVYRPTPEEIEQAEAEAAAAAAAS